MGSSVHSNHKLPVIVRVPIHTTNLRLHILYIIAIHCIPRCSLKAYWRWTQSWFPGNWAKSWCSHVNTLQAPTGIGKLNVFMLISLIIALATSQFRDRNLGASTDTTCIILYINTAFTLLTVYVADDCWLCQNWLSLETSNIKWLMSYTYLWKAIRRTWPLGGKKNISGGITKTCWWLAISMVANRLRTHSDT